MTPISPVEPVAPISQVESIASTEVGGSIDDKVNNKKRSSSSNVQSGVSVNHVNDFEDDDDVVVSFTVKRVSAKSTSNGPFVGNPAGLVSSLCWTSSAGRKAVVQEPELPAVAVSVKSAASLEGSGVAWDLLAGLEEASEQQNAMVSFAQYT